MVVLLGSCVLVSVLRFSFWNEQGKGRSLCLVLRVFDLIIRGNILFGRILGLTDGLIVDFLRYIVRNDKSLIEIVIYFRDPEF